MAWSAVQSASGTLSRFRIVLGSALDLSPLSESKKLVGLGVAQRLAVVLALLEFGAHDRGRVKTRRNFANDRAEQNFSRFFRL